MTNLTSLFPRKDLFQTTILPLLVLIAGIGAALIVTFLMMDWLMSPSRDEMVVMLTELSTWAVISVGVGFVLYRAVAWQSRSLSLTLAFASLWAAVLSIFNVWIVARLMFFESHDFTLTIILLIFAAIIATSFGISATSRVSNDLKELSTSAGQIAAGDLSARALVRSQDEVGRVAETFNEMATQLQAAQQQREELEKLRRDLIAWTSHDLRTPLTSIRAMIEALHDGIVTDEEMVKRYYRTIRADIVSLNDLLDDLFELAQLDAGGLQLEFDEHSLGDLVSDTLESFHAVAQKKGIKLVGKVGEGVDPVSLNAAKMSRVLSNLVNNALRYTPEGGTVCVQAERVATGVQVQVQDSGTGFNEHDVSRIFERFYRGEEARTRATGGAGLGLAIARGIVEAHNGRIWAENAAEGGAIVGFELPK